MTSAFSFARLMPLCFTLQQLPITSRPKLTCSSIGTGQPLNPKPKSRSFNTSPPSVCSRLPHLKFLDDQQISSADRDRPASPEACDTRCRFQLNTPNPNKTEPLMTVLRLKSPSTPIRQWLLRPLQASQQRTLPTYHPTCPISIPSAPSHPASLSVAIRHQACRPPSPLGAAQR